MAYVRYLNDEEVVSASTDSTLRLWNVNKPHAVRVYEGHVNEKNFVGLCADGEFIACGSELNEVCIGICLRMEGVSFVEAHSWLQTNLPALMTCLSSSQSCLFVLCAVEGNSEASIFLVCLY